MADPPGKPKPRIAVACSGLGHIQRGIEAWAEDLGVSLRRAGEDAVVFGGAPLGAPAEEDSKEEDGEEFAALRCLRRNGLGARGIAGALRRLGGWRIGLGSPYDVEQASFAFSLWRRVRRDFDIVHVQDPILAIWMERFYRWGLSRARVIYANGTGEGPKVMRRFAWLQLLTAGAEAAWRGQAPPEQTVFVVPNAVDGAMFSPGGRFSRGDRWAARARLGLPEMGYVVLCCSAIRREHKRVDQVVAEFASALERPGMAGSTLVVVGAHEGDTDELIAQSEAMLGARVRFFVNLPRAEMVEIYRAADLLVLGSLSEMFGIALIEAMACGVPVLCHDTPAFRDIAGPAGWYCDLTVAGTMADGMVRLREEGARRVLGAVARPHAMAIFGADAVTRRVVAMYQRVVDAESRV